ncbi:MAG: acetolactate synthase small subunit [Actinomycetaceae bacterium]|nr:acetolactate synthase small subunit [Actinomycetaceae bacterium]
MPPKKSSSLHTLSVLVENKPGVLTRVSALFSRRAFNIHSLAVGPTDHPDVSRITVVVKAQRVPFEQITKQLNKLVNVIKIVELEPGASVQRKLTLVKVRADRKTRSAVLQIVDVFRAHVVDMGPQSVVVEAVGSEEKTDALLTALESYGIEEIVQSGIVGIGRGLRSMTEQLKEK